MKSPTLYRIAAGLYVLFALGHTFGFLTFEPPTPEGLAVWHGMENVHFPIGAGTASYAGFYRGFGLNISAYMVFSAYLAWYLSGLARNAPRAIGGLGWAFFALQLVGLGLACVYFPGPPALFAALAAIVLGWAAWRPW